VAAVLVVLLDGLDTATLAGGVTLLEEVGDVEEAVVAGLDANAGV
jgi:hypothetical protein